MSLFNKLRNSAVAAYASMVMGACSGSSSDYVQHQQKQTDRSGEVCFAEDCLSVKDEAGSPLEKMVVHYLNDGERGFFLAVDPSGRYQQNYADRSPAGSGSQALSSNISSLQQALTQDFVMYLWETGQDVLEVKQIKKSTFLSDDRNFNKYCQSMEQINKTSLDLPAALILLPVKFAAEEAADIKTSRTKPVKEIFENWVYKHYGQHAAYEVWVPKTAMSLCGGDFDGMLCDISDGKLADLWRTDLPMWMIRGPCERKDEENKNKSNCAPEPGLVFCDDFDGPKLDRSKWDTNILPEEEKYLTFSDGVLELEVPVEGKGVLNGKTHHILGDDTWIFEARGKTSEKKGMGYNAALFNQSNDLGYGFIGFGMSPESGLISGGNNNNLQIQPEGTLSNAEATGWHTVRFEGNKNEIKYYVDGQLFFTAKKNIPFQTPLFVIGSCDSFDGTPKQCLFDYIKLIVK